MNFVKRSFLHVVKKYDKSILLIILLSVIGSLVLSGLSIKNASEEAKILAREKLGAEVTLQFDFDRYFSGMIDDGEDGLLRKEEVEQLLTLPQVEAYNFLTIGTALPVDFEPIDIFEDEDGEIEMEGFHYLLSTFIKGLVDSSRIENFSSENYELVEGRHLT